MSGACQHARPATGVRQGGRGGSGVGLPSVLVQREGQGVAGIGDLRSSSAPASAPVSVEERGLGGTDSQAALRGADVEGQNSPACATDWHRPGLRQRHSRQGLCVVRGTGCAGQSAGDGGDGSVDEPAAAGHRSSRLRPAFSSWRPRACCYPMCRAGGRGVGGGRDRGALREDQQALFSSPRRRAIALDPARTPISEQIYALPPHPCTLEPASGVSTLPQPVTQPVTPTTAAPTSAT